MLDEITEAYLNEPTPASAHTIQAYVELVYSQAANDILYNNLGSLYENLQLTKQAADLLNKIQALKNEAVVVTSTFNFNFETGGAGIGSIESYGSAYIDAASAFFGHKVIISYDSKWLVGGSSRIQFFSARKQLSAFLPILSSFTPSADKGAGSLFAKLTTVYEDMVAKNSNPPGWVIDAYNATGSNAINAGKIQQNITSAITASQSLNTTQTERVRNYMFLFEEYYKSASSILTQITQIIQKMAEGIGR